MHCTGVVGPHEPAVLLTVVEGRVYPRISYKVHVRTDADGGGRKVGPGK